MSRNTNPLSKEEDEEICQRMGGGLCVREDFERMVDADGMSHNPELMCLFWHGGFGRPSYLLKEDRQVFSVEMKMWRARARKGEINIIAANCQSHEYKGRNFYGLCLQYHEQPSGELVDVSDPLSLTLFGYLCSGITYYFTSKQNRDKIRDYVMKGLDENRFN